MPISGGGGSATTFVACANLTGGTITHSGTIALQTLAASSLFGNSATVSGAMVAIPLASGLALNSGTLNTTLGLFDGTGINLSPGPSVTISLADQAASTLLGNFGTISGPAEPVTIGANLTLTS